MEQRYFKKLQKLLSENETYNLNLDDAFISRAASTVISKGYGFQITPAEIELSGFKKGKPLKQKPKLLKNVYQYFFDEQGNVILRVDMENNPQIIGRLICQYEEDYMLIYHYVSGKLSAVQFYSPNQNVLLGKGRHGEYKYEYYYESNRLIKMVRYQAYNTDKVSSNDFLFEYEDDKIKRICRECPNGYKELIYPIRKALS